jgi:hypothetical protein
MWEVFTAVTGVALILLVAAEQASVRIEVNPIIIGSDWETLGPFQTGTREQQWGADPLEAYGGFSNITYDDREPFASSLNGTVYFRILTSSPPSIENNLVTQTIPVSFPDTDWKSLEKVFGWSALQFQAWIRGTIKIHHHGRYGLWIGNAVEFRLDGTYYDVGNLYDADIAQFTRGGLFLDLSSGEHILEIRVVNDIRAFGGQIPPKVEIHIAMREVREDLVVANYDSHGGWVVPTVLNMTRKDAQRGYACVGGDWASFALRNEGRDWVIITALRVDEVSLGFGFIDSRDNRKSAGRKNVFVLRLGNNALFL